MNSGITVTLPIEQYQALLKKVEESDQDKSRMLDALANALENASVTPTKGAVVDVIRRMKAEIQFPDKK